MKDNVRLLRNLDRLLFDDAGETSDEVRQRLEQEGVNVKELVAHVKAAAGEAYRQRLAAEAKDDVAETLIKLS